MVMRRFFGGEHPVTAVVAVVAIICVILLIVWARLALHGTDARGIVDLEVDAAVTANRFATGFSP